MDTPTDMLYFLKYRVTNVTLVSQEIILHILNSTSSLIFMLLINNTLIIYLHINV